MAKVKLNRKNVSANLWGYLFIAPLSVGLILFLLYPLITAFYYSVSTYDLFSPPQYIGFGNYVRAFSDQTFWYSVRNAFISAIGVPIGIFCAMVIAAMIVSIDKGSNVFRAIIFIPTICGSVAVTFIWQFIYTPMYGLLPVAFTQIGLTPPQFLSDDYFMLSMIVMGLWSGLGIGMLLCIASLKNIPKMYYEAARVDGAGPIRVFFAISLPGLSPVAFYLLVTGLIGALQDFTRFQVMKGGLYSDASIMPVWWIYNYTGLFGLQYGYASALSMILGIIILLISIINFVVSKYWVKYDT